MTFEIQLHDGRKIGAAFSSQHRETLLEAFNGYARQTRILVRGVGRINRGGRLVGLESVDSAAILEALDVPSRLDDFRSLRPGWLDGHGAPPPPDSLDWLASTFEQYYPDDLELPYLYPTEDGGVSAEWSLGKIEASLTVDLSTREGAWHAFETSGGDADEAVFDLNSSDGWEALSRKLRHYAGGTA